MTKGNASGHSLGKNDIPIVLGMVNRGDRNHDIAAWFGVNPGRIAEVKNGKMGFPNAAQPNSLPPSGAPGIKAKRIRDKADKLLQIVADLSLSDNDARAKMETVLKEAINQFDRNEA